MENDLSRYFEGGDTSDFDIEAGPQTTPTARSNRRCTVGVLGSFASDSGLNALVQSWQFGWECGRRGLPIVTDALAELTLEVTYAARAAGGTSTSISPMVSREEHNVLVGDPDARDSTVIYTGSDWYEVMRTIVASSDVVVFMGGDEELVRAFELATALGKVVGVLLGAGGIADNPQGLYQCFVDGGGGVVLYSTEASSLLGSLLALEVDLTADSQTQIHNQGAMGPIFHGRINDTDVTLTIRVNDEIPLGDWGKSSEYTGSPYIPRRTHPLDSTETPIDAQRPFDEHLYA